MSDVEIRSVAYLRELSRCHDDWPNDPACLAAEWAADEIERLRNLLAAVRDEADDPKEINGAWWIAIPYPVWFAAASGAMV